MSNHAHTVYLSTYQHLTELLAGLGYICTTINPQERMRMSFISRYVYTYEEFVIVTEAPQSNKMTATGQDTDNKNNLQIYNR